MYHKDRTTPPEGDWIFVFGSNLAGRHGAGAAKAAAQHYGAQYGVGKGRTGMSYAIPTKDEDLRTLPLEDIHEYVERFDTYIDLNPELNFWMTRIGCGLAGYKDSDIAPMFTPLAGCKNISWPEDWRKYLED